MSSKPDPRCPPSPAISAIATKREDQDRRVGDTLRDSTGGRYSPDTLTTAAPSEALLGAGLLKDRGQEVNEEKTPLPVVPFPSTWRGRLMGHRVIHFTVHFYGSEVSRNIQA